MSTWALMIYFIPGRLHSACLLNRFSCNWWTIGVDTWFKQVVNHRAQKSHTIHQHFYQHLAHDIWNMWENATLGLINMFFTWDDSDLGLESHGGKKTEKKKDKHDSIFQPPGKSSAWSKLGALNGTPHTDSVGIVG